MAFLLDSSVESRATPALPYPWQIEQWQLMSQQFLAGRCPHALLLSGPEFVGKARFSLAFARFVLCATPVQGQACGTCKACKLFAAGSHPDFLLIEPEDTGKAIKIGQVREINDFVSTTAQQGSWKVAVITPAEAMNVNSYNALLKNLEEPSANTLLILVCHQPSRLPATIRSRTRILAFPVPSHLQGLNWLSQVVNDSDLNLDHLLAEANDKPLMALKLIEGDLLEEKNQFMTLLNAVSNRELSPLEAAERCFKLNSKERVDWLMMRVATTIKESTGSPSVQRWFDYMDRAMAAKRELQSSNNPNLQLLWESLMMDWQAISGSGN